MAREAVEDYYPYPSHVNVANFVSVRLSCRDVYDGWETQLLCLFESHGMLGFIDGSLVKPTVMHRVQSSIFVHTKGLENNTKSRYKLWRRSDALVKGWILGSLTKKVVMYAVGLLKTELSLQNRQDITSKGLWDKLRSGVSTVLVALSLLVLNKVSSSLYFASFLSLIFSFISCFSSDSKDKEIQEIAESRGQANPLPEETREEAQTEADEKAKKEAEEKLYKCTIEGYLGRIKGILEEGKVKITDKISINGNTALHVAIGTGKDARFVTKLLESVESDLPLDMQNSEGSTPLHVAAIVGNIDAAKLLVDRNQDLLYAEDNERCTPLARALSNMHIDLFLYLMDRTKSNEEKGRLIDGESGNKLLVNAISSKRFGEAIRLLDRSPTMKSNAALMAVTQNFPRELTGWETKFYPGTDDWDDLGDGCLGNFFDWCGDSLDNKIFRVLCTIPFIILLMIVAGRYCLLRILAPLVSHFWKLEDVDQVNTVASRLLRKIGHKIKDSNNSGSHHIYYTNPILEAAKLDAYEVVEHLVSSFPNAIWSINEDGHNIIQVAVIYRSENVYNLLYQMSEHKNVYKTIEDSLGNNLLHLAGRLAPSNKLNLISGAALQIQRELQWFQEVKKFVCPLNIMQRNSSDETPQMVFSREHKGLVIEGEKWMKATAESYTITAALITTVVFAAAITVPGGSHQDTGIPVFTNDVAFTIFAVSNAISLFAATTSLLMFLSILTARFAEQDFLIALPTKLIIGLATLFISTTGMLVAFSTTLFLVFGQKKAWILIPIAALTCLPIASFVTLQYPLIADLIRST